MRSRNWALICDVIKYGMFFAAFGKNRGTFPRPNEILEETVPLLTSTVDLNVLQAVGQISLRSCIPSAHCDAKNGGETT